MILSQLVEKLRKQVAAHSSISLNEDILSQSKLNNLRQVFLLEENEYLTINNINHVPEPQGKTLEIAAETTALLKRSNIALQVLFEVDDKDVIEYLIALKMDENWSFKESFSNLANVFPFNENFIVFSDSYFVYSSQAKSKYSPWSDQPNELISLQPGLNFVSWVKLDILSLATDWLTDVVNIDKKYKCWGSVAPNKANPYPVMKLTIPLVTSSFKLVDNLSLGHPSLIIEITEPVGLIQRIDLRLAASTEDLEFGVSISRGSSGLTFNAEPKKNGQFTTEKILNLPGGKDFHKFIPNELNQAFKNCSLKQFSVVAQSKRISFISLSIGTPENFKWSLIPNVITLKNITLEIESLAPLAANSFTTVFLRASCQLFSNIFPGAFDFRIELDNGGDGHKWKITTISGSYHGSVALSGLVAEIIGRNATVPEELSKIKFSEFGVNVTKQDTSYSYSLYCQSEAIFSILDTQFISSLSVVFNYRKTGYEMDLVGAFAVKQENFRLELKLDKSPSISTEKPEKAISSAVMKASWKTVDQYLQLEDIAKAFGFSDNEIPKVPQELDLSLRSVNLTYDFSDKKLAMALDSAKYGKAFFVAIKNPTRQFVFGLTIDQTIDLSHLPLIDKKFPSEQSIKVNDLQLLISAQDITPPEITTINNLIPENFPKLPEQPTTVALPKGLNVAAQMQFGSITTPLALPVSADTQPTPPNQPALPAPTSPSTSDNATWFKLQKTFGPVHFERVGVQYKDAAIWFLLDAALSVAGLTLSLEGLSVGSSLSKFEPKFNLRGLGIDYKNGPIEIGGAFLKGKITFQGKEYDDYSGTAIIRTKKLTLAAIGSYVQLDIGPSMFVYAVLDCPIGGPPFFFVQGLAVGFGYNRLLHVPPVDRIDTFPLVQEAVGGLAGTPNLADELAKLQQYIPPSAGNYFLAIGICFTSFKMIDSFILVTAKFGHRFELDVVGLSTLILPAADAESAGITPIAEVQLALRGTFIPDDGFFGISAQLTRNSFLLSRRCHLTGGFAFYTWFSGIHEGDFVLTVGGYHPQFSRPSHYPTVPRLGFNWQVDDHLTLKGSAYYALTPSMLMAGVSLNATWHKSNLQVWFNAAINFLISWKPYHYSADFHVNIAASYTFNFFGTHQIAAHVGANVSIWGPDFTGQAHVDLSVISFTIHFGSSKRSQIKSISWILFYQSFLPTKEQNGRKEIDAAKMCTINLKTGLINRRTKKDRNDTQQTDTEDLGVVNAKTLCLTTDSVIPAHQAYRGEQGQNLLDHAGATVAFNIGTMQLKNEQLISTQRIIIIHYDINRDRISVEDQFDFHPLTKNAPAALWGSQLQPSLNGEQLVKNLLTGYEIRVKRLDDAPHTEPINYAKLQQAATLDPEPDAFSWSSLIPFVPQAADDDTRRETIHNTLYNNDVAGRREAIANALLGESLNLANLSADDFLSAPQVNVLIAR